jgi:hypothetical protein
VDSKLGAWKVLNGIIEDEVVPSVGGAVQYGKVVDEDFVLFGVRDIVVDHASKTFRTRLRLGGIELYSDTLAQTDEGFVLRRSFIDLASAEEARLLAAGYMPEITPHPLANLGTM